MSFSVAFHVKGCFVSHPRYYYKSGEVHVVHKLDQDKWSYFEASGILKEDFGLSGKLTLWWKEKEDCFEDGLKRIRDDKDAFIVAKYVITNQCVVDIYVEVDVQGGTGVGPSENVPGSSSGKGQKKSGGRKQEKEDYKRKIVEERSVDSANSDGEVGDDSVGDVHFSDSEEEMMVSMDDGFEFPTQESVQTISYGSPKGMRRKFVPAKRLIGKGRKKTVPSSSHGGIYIAGSVGAGDDVTSTPLLIGTHGHGEGHEMEPEYLSEELEIDYDSSGSEDGSRPRYVRYRKEEMSRQFKFKLGMEFGSLKEFKDAILEHFVLNGREIKFEKNDNI